MIKELEIKGYRNLDDFKVEGLARVNLIVGKNNIGKTNLLQYIKETHQSGCKDLTHWNLLNEQCKVFLGDDMFSIIPLRDAAWSVGRVYNGIATEDNFGQGLHYSLFDKLWDFIFTITERLNIQFFATTHSRDCIESFNRIAQQRIDPTEAVLFRMGRSVITGDIVARHYTEDELNQEIEMGLDVRG